MSSGVIGVLRLRKKRAMRDPGSGSAKASYGQNRPKPRYGRVHHQFAMKTKLPILFLAAFTLTACDTKVAVNPPDNNTTIVTPAEKKTETNTTIVTPPAPATEKKTETKTVT